MALLKTSTSDPVDGISPLFKASSIYNKGEQFKKKNCRDIQMLYVSNKLSNKYYLP
jgi:hypothetical protein